MQTRVTKAISDIEIEKSERKEEMRGMHDEFSGLRETIKNGLQQTTNLITNLQMNLQNQMKMTVSKDDLDTFMRRMETMMFAERQMQLQPNILYQINDSQMDGCLNKHAHDNKENENMPRKLHKTNKINIASTTSVETQGLQEERYHKPP